MLRLAAAKAALVSETHPVSVRVGMQGLSFMLKDVRDVTAVVVGAQEGKHVGQRIE